MFIRFKKSTRCQCKTLDNKNCRNKQKNCYIINNKRYCKLHFNYNYVKYIIIIQKSYRYYKCRRYLNIYNKLPDDIQYIIKYYINESLRLVKYLKINLIYINNLITKSFNIFTKDLIDNTVYIILHKKNNIHNIIRFYQEYKNNIDISLSKKYIEKYIENKLYNLYKFLVFVLSYNYSLDNFTNENINILITLHRLLNYELYTSLS
jgi:hypothetical protein